MKTISFRFKYDDKKLQDVLLEDSRICSSMKRFVFNRLKEKKTKVTIDMVMKLRSHSGALTDALVRRYLSTEPVKKKCYKVPARIVEKYFVGMDPNKVDSIVEQALEAWFHKGKDGADV